MLKVAITGNIASGKSCVEKFIQDAGYKVIDADIINHEILRNDSDVINKIKEAFSDYDISNDNGSISREKLGRIVFSDIDKKNILEGILHKRINEKINKYINENNKEKCIFVSASQLFESGFYKDYDKIIFVYAPDEMRLKRLIERNEYTEYYAKQRINAQAPQENKIKKSDYIIINISDMENIRNQTNLILKQISSLY